MILPCCPFGFLCVVGRAVASAPLLQAITTFPGAVLEDPDAP